MPVDLREACRAVHVMWAVGCAYGFLINPEPCYPYRFCRRYNKHRPTDTNITESKSNENRCFYRTQCLPVYA